MLVEFQKVISCNQSPIQSLRLIKSCFNQWMYFCSARFIEGAFNGDFETSLNKVSQRGSTGGGKSSQLSITAVKYYFFVSGVVF